MRESALCPRCGLVERTALYADAGQGPEYAARPVYLPMCRWCAWGFIESLQRYEEDAE